jgi:uncharacterized protein (UPF0210 family)
MKIRTITCFADPGFPLAAEVMRTAATTTGAVRRALTDGGYDVQTVRLALPPFAPALGGDARRVVPLAVALESACRASGIEYATIGAARAGDDARFFDAIPDAIAATTAVFASALVAETGRGADLDALSLAARVIHRSATVSPDGFGNLRFAALFNVPAGVPFLPAAYHGGGEPAIAIGVEAADVAVEAVAGAGTLAEARDRLVRAVEEHTRRIVEFVTRSAGGMRFGGVDFSLAPFPDQARSIGAAIERLSGGRIGAASTLAAVAFLADSVDRASFPRTGYSGMFLPVFEDAVLAARAAEGRLSINDLLLYSSVCGTGLDTVPLPGDTPVTAIAAILLDVAALALRLDKPLSARLMPIPGKGAGDAITFDFPFFASSRVLKVDRPEGRGLFGGGFLDIRPRP